MIKKGADSAPFFYPRGQDRSGNRLTLRTLALNCNRMETPGHNGLANRAGLALGIFLCAYNNLVNFLPSLLHAKVYVVLNLACLAGIWIMVRKYLRLSNAEMGWSRRGLGAGLLWGLAFTAAVIIPFIIALKILPGTGWKISPPRGHRLKHLVACPFPDSAGHRLL
jgi:hypothetical protein